MLLTFTVPFIQITVWVEAFWVDGIQRRRTIELSVCVSNLEYSTVVLRWKGTAGLLFCDRGLTGLSANPLSAEECISIRRCDEAATSRLWSAMGKVKLLVNTKLLFWCTICSAFSFKTEANIAGMCGVWEISLASLKLTGFESHFNGLWGLTTII